MSENPQASEACPRCHQPMQVAYSGPSEYVDPLSGRARREHVTVLRCDRHKPAGVLTCRTSTRDRKGAVP